MRTKKTKSNKTKKEPTAAQLKKKLWKLFTYYIKLKYSSENKFVDCYTCGKPLEIGTSNCQGGHYYNKKKYTGLYFDENNVRPQCYYCNINLGGNIQIFREKLIEEIGIEGVNDLDNRRNSLFKKSRSEYKELIELYNNKIDLLKNM